MIRKHGNLPRKNYNDIFLCLSFSRGSVYPGRVALNPGAFVVLRLAVASANVNANEMSAIPLPVDTLKKNSAKKKCVVGGGTHTWGAQFYFWAGSLHLFLNASMHKRKLEQKKNKNRNSQKDHKSCQVWDWCRNHFN